MNAALSHPAIVSVVVPGVVAVLATWVLRRAPVLGLGCGVGVSLVLLFGWPALPPQGATQKLCLLVAAGALFGAGLTPAIAPRWRLRAAVVFVVAAGVLLAAAQVAQLPVLLTLLCIGGSAMHLAREPLPDPRLASRVLLAAGVGGVAFAAGSLVLAQSACAVGAAAAGAAVTGSRALDAAEDLFLGTGTLLLLALMIVLTTSVRAWALLPLLAVAPCARVATRAPGGRTRIGGALWQAVLCALPVALAIAAVVLSSHQDEAYTR